MVSQTAEIFERKTRQNSDTYYSMTGCVSTGKSKPGEWEIANKIKLYLYGPKSKICLKGPYSQFNSDTLYS